MNFSKDLNITGEFQTDKFYFNNYPIVYRIVLHVTSLYPASCNNLFMIPNA